MKLLISSSSFFIPSYHTTKNTLNNHAPSSPFTIRRTREDGQYLDTDRRQGALRNQETVAPHLEPTVRRGLGHESAHHSQAEPRHPDGSLTLETVDRIYSTLTALCSLYFGPEEMDDEYRRLADSRMRIARSVAPLPAAVRKRLEEEQGQKEKGDVPLRPVHPLG